MRRAALALAVLFVAAAAGAAGLRVAWERYLAGPVGPAGRVEVVEVPAGMGFNALADALGRRGLVDRPRALKVLVRLRGLGSALKAGEYEIGGALRPDELVRRLVAGQVLLHPLTIPEGLTLAEIALRVEAAGFGTAAELRAAADAPELKRRLGLAAEQSLEGYLFPETYAFPKGTGAEAVVRAMVDAFERAYSPELAARAEALGWTRHQVVTLASIVEKETGAEDERTRVSAVFHNRLRRGMRLQSDPTVIYGLEDFDGNLTRRHLRTPTPYNTYTIAGLPPGPIASPGRASLEAALWPADTRDLYFVATGDGRHVFNERLADHERAVDRYQRRRPTGRRAPGG